MSAFQFYQEHCDHMKASGLASPIMSLSDGTSQPLIRPQAFSSSPPVETPNFTVFSRLPLELQTMIWQSFEIKVRVICFHRTTNEGIHRFKIDVSCKSPPSILLRTCQESRRVALRDHRFILKDSKLYINFSVDLFYFDDYETYAIFLEHYLRIRLYETSQIENMVKYEELARHLQHVVIDDAFGDGMEYKDLNQYTYFKGLESVTILNDLTPMILDFKDLRFPKKDLRERWDDAWKKVTGVVPLLLQIEHVDIIRVEEGRCDYFLERVEELCLERDAIDLAAKIKEAEGKEKEKARVKEIEDGILMVL